MRKALGIDVGGTKIYSAIINEKGEILSEIEKYHTPKTFVEIQAIFKEIIEKHEKEVDVIAFSTCGAVNKTNDGILGSESDLGTYAEGERKKELIFQNLSCSHQRCTANKC